MSNFFFKSTLFGHNIIFEFKLTVLTQAILTLDLALIHGHSNIKEMKLYVTKFISVQLLIQLMHIKVVSPDKILHYIFFIIIMHINQECHF